MSSIYFLMPFVALALLLRSRADKSLALLLNICAERFSLPLRRTSSRLAEHSKLKGIWNSLSPRRTGSHGVDHGKFSAILNSLSRKRDPKSCLHEGAVKHNPKSYFSVWAVISFDERTVVTRGLGLSVWSHHGLALVAILLVSTSTFAQTLTLTERQLDSIERLRSGNLEEMRTSVSDGLMQPDQVESIEQLTMQEFMAMVQEYHPFARQANLILEEGQAELLRARGGFDPKLEVDYDRKKFKGTEYYDRLNAAFKIPTWYGIEFKAGFEDNSGEFLNPEAVVPDDGLYSAGVSVSLAQGLLINERMATLRQARFFQEQTLQDQILATNDILYDAGLAYLDWLQASMELEVYREFRDLAVVRLEGVRLSYEAGDKPRIDVVEARVELGKRELSLRQAVLNFQKAQLMASSYLWIQDVPVQIEDDVQPVVPVSIINGAQIGQLPNLGTHPKILSLEAKARILAVDTRLKRNKLLPKVDLEYNFLNEEYDDLPGFSTADYKSGLRISFPVFLRRERGDLRLARIKQESLQLELEATTWNLTQKIAALNAEVFNLTDQVLLASEVLEDNNELVRGERRKFELGDSSLFLVNSRESKLVDTQLKAIAVQLKLLESQLTLGQVQAVLSQ